MKEESELKNKLILPQKESLLTKFFKWIANIFGKNNNALLEETIVTQVPSITVPTAVTAKEPIKNLADLDKNSLEYLYQLSDEELDALEENYNQQIEDNKTEIERLNGILQSYKDSIKVLQGQLAEE